MVCTTVYLPPDQLALKLGGSKAWPGRARLLAFGRDHCDVEPAESAAIIDRTLAAALDHRPASSDDAMWAAMRRELAAAAATLTPGH